MKLIGENVQKLYFFLSILILAAFLAGCAPKAAARPAEVKALQNPTPTEVPEKLVIASPQPEALPPDPPESCPITVPQDPPFIPPAPYDAMGFEGEFWYGSASLWTAI